MKKVERTPDIVEKEAYNVLKKSLIEIIDKNEDEGNIFKALGVTDDEYEEYLSEKVNLSHFLKVKEAQSYTEAVKYCLEDSDNFNVFIVRVLQFFRWKFKKDQLMNPNAIMETLKHLLK
jgi:hypothetical protein